MRLPPEVCEYIIDSCRSAQSTCWASEMTERAWPELAERTSSYKTWCACALTCHAWLARSRYNLYFLVELRRTRHVNMLLRTLTENPALADLVVVLAARPPKALGNGHGLPGYELSDWYIPIIQHPLPSCLRNCRSLILDIDLHLYPAWFTNMVPRIYSAVVDLNLLNTTLPYSWSKVPASALLLFVSSLPNLRRLAVCESTLVFSIHEFLDLTPLESRQLKLEFTLEEVIIAQNPDGGPSLGNGHTFMSLFGPSIGRLTVLGSHGFGEKFTTAISEILERCSQLRTFWITSIERDLNPTSQWATQEDMLTDLPVAWHSLLLTATSHCKQLTTLGINVFAFEPVHPTDVDKMREQAKVLALRHAGKETESLLKQLPELRRLIFAFPLRSDLSRKVIRQAFVDRMPQLAEAIEIWNTINNPATDTKFLEGTDVCDLLPTLEEWYTPRK